MYERDERGEEKGKERERVGKKVFCCVGSIRKIVKRIEGVKEQTQVGITLIVGLLRFLPCNFKVFYRLWLMNKYIFPL